MLSASSWRTFWGRYWRGSTDELRVNEHSLDQRREHLRGECNDGDNEDESKPHCGKTHCDEPANEGTEKHGDAENCTELVINDTMPCKYDRRNRRREHVDDFGSRHGLKKCQPKEQDEDGCQHGHIPPLKNPP